MKRIIPTLVLSFWISGFAHAAALDPQVKELSNTVMLSIYQEILDLKGRYKELSSFGEDALFENNRGIYSIIYQDQKGAAERRGVRYEFGLTIDGMEDENFKLQDGRFNLGFPLLGIKFSGFQGRLRSNELDLIPLIRKHGMTLYGYQQEQLPLRLYLEPVRESYRPGEEIEFEVTLKNVSARHMVVKDLGEESLYFIFNNAAWGTSPTGGETAGKDVVLKSGESLRRRFRGEGFQSPRDIEIQGVYRMSIEGVNPSGTLRAQVVP